MPDAWIAALPVALNAIIIIAIVLLWIMWWRNARRQRRIEAMLAESSGQLQEASALLNEALGRIEELKQYETKHTPSACRLPASDSSGKNGTDAETLCRLIPELARAGKSPEEIARELDLPIGQVRLMVKLYADRA